MRVLFCGDKHLKINKLDLAKKFLTWMNKTIEEQKPDLYVCLGDDLDTHSIVRSELLTEMRYHFDHILSLGIPVVYVVGNHDCFKPNDMKYHAFQSMINLHPNLHIVDEVQELYGMTFVPYIHDSDKFPKQTLPICVAHQTFKGADYGDITAQDGVDASSLVGTQLVISGHIHKRSRMDLGRVQLLYIGSPFSQSASDIDQIKGVSVIETDTYKEDFIKCPLPAWRGLRFQLSQSFGADELYEELVSSLNDNDHWVLELTGPKNELNSLLSTDRFKDLIKGRSVKIKTVFTDSQKQRVQIKSISMADIVSEYIAKVYSGSIDREKLISASAKLLADINK